MQVATAFAPVLMASIGFLIAQEPIQRTRPAGRTSSYRGHGWGYDYPFGQATSGYEGRANAYSTVIGARVYAAQANEQLKSEEQERKLRATQIHFEKRKLGDERRAQRKAAMQQRVASRLDREAEHRSAIVKSSERGLTPSQMDPLTGRIAWPIGLLGKSFDKPRGELDQLFADRAKSGGLADSSARAQTVTTIDAMQEELKKHIGTMGTSNYLVARNFLQSVAQAAGSNSS